MSELAGAVRLLSNLPKNQIIQFPSGKWGFVGSVDARLAFANEDGSPVSDEQIDIARRFGPRLAKVRKRVWDSKEAAQKSLAELPD